MSWWLPESQSKEYQETVEFAQKAANNPNRGAFGRFSGRPSGIYSWNELVTKNYLDRHKIEYHHNVKARTLIHDPMLAPSFEIDFWIPRGSVALSIDPLFHLNSGHPVTNRVMLNDQVKEAILSRHGIETIHLIAYEDPHHFASEIITKLQPLTRY